MEDELLTGLTPYVGVPLLAALVWLWWCGARVFFRAGFAQVSGVSAVSVALVIGLFGYFVVGLTAPAVAGSYWFLFAAGRMRRWLVSVS